MLTSIAGINRGGEAVKLRDAGGEYGARAALTRRLYETLPIPRQFCAAFPKAAHFFVA